MALIDRFKILLPFWIVSSFYFLIPFIRNPINAPQFFLYIDNLIPFVWWMIIPYYMYYIGLVIPLIVKDKILLNHFVHVSLILLGISYITFIIWPISCAPVMLSVTQNPLSFLYGAVEISWLKQNGLPSVHVTISLFTALVLGMYRPRYRIIFLVCAFLVFLSTFLSKQHFIADSLSGLLLAYFGFFYWKRTMRNN
ncbi:MAG: hypothetical protein CMG41_01900 [Candidatus Marinimicrobia bacterium]|nr:hypothetical protein [Candidatus Neomarinimicrobiota bacterium]